MSNHTTVLRQLSVCGHSKSVDWLNLNPSCARQANNISIVRFIVQFLVFIYYVVSFYVFTLLPFREFTFHVTFVYGHHIRCFTHTVFN